MNGGNIMKKLLSITLALVLALTALFSLSASAAENRSEKFINDLFSTKTISVTLDDSAFNGLLKDVTLNVKLGNSIQIAGSGKALGFIKVRLYGGEAGLDAYIGSLGLFRVDISEIIGGNLEFAGITERILPVLEKAETYKKYLKLDTENSTANCDKFVIDKEAAKNDFIDQTDFDAAGLTDLGITKEALKEKTFDEILVMLDQLGNDEMKAQAQAIANIAKSWIAFNYSGDKLVGIDLNFCDENGEVTTVGTGDIGFDFTSISTGVADSAFIAPRVSIDLTNLLKGIISKFVG